jgi:DNA polymerase
MDRDALAALRLQVEFGADEALEDTPVDRLRAPPAGAPAAVAGRTWVAEVPAAVALATPILAAATTPAAPQLSAAERAREAAAAAATLDALYAVIAGFDGCALRDIATQAVLPVGDPCAGLLLIGEPPAAEDDRAGRPFSGPAGGTLDRMLASIALDRSKLLLVSLIPWRPPGNRPPTAAELAACLPFLYRLIELSAPRRVVVLGTLAARSLLGATRRRAPAWTELVLPGTAGRFPSLAMPAPTAVAQGPAERRTAWMALRLLRRALDADIAHT